MTDGLDGPTDDVARYEDRLSRHELQLVKKRGVGVCNHGQVGGFDV